MSWNLFSSTPSADPGAMRDTTTRSIALWLLATFIATVVALLWINFQAFRFGENKYVAGVTDAVVKADHDMRLLWFDVLKSSLILLGTALTTVIGYYFGQREGAAKAARAEVNEAATDRRAAVVVNDSVSNAVEALRQNSAPQNVAPPSSAGEQALDPDVVEPK